MRFKDLKIGFALTGSHCTVAAVLPYLRLLKEEGARVIPIFSPAVLSTDTRYGTAEELLGKVTEICGEKPLTTLVEVEPIGPQKLLDLVVVAPCTGNTLAKLALGVTDTSVLLACKAQLRNNRPVVIAVSTNDGLSANARNLGLLLNRRNIFFVPFGQDAPRTKQTSLVAKMSLLPETILEALQNRQIQPILITPN
ncbi:MAG: dipicolinate synthase subunit B [Firmicutes bacterium]|nr:dipicolinate synthase subunit B [Bacillota bacterium]